MEEIDYSPHTAPAYTPTEASRYLGIAVSTTRAWIKGYRYKTKSGYRRFKPVILMPDPQYLSFQNLIELLVLSAIRKKYNVRLPKVRAAAERLRSRFGTDHPLAEVNLLTDKKDLFVEALGEYLNITQEGQIEMRRMLEKCVLRIERDENNQITRFYPYPIHGNSPSRSIEINPRVRFGRPCIAGTGIPTDVVYGRHQSGESIDLLAYDYECPIEKIRTAIRYEEQIHKHAA